MNGQRDISKLELQRSTSNDERLALERACDEASVSITKADHDLAQVVIDTKGQIAQLKSDGEAAYEAAESSARAEFSRVAIELETSAQKSKTESTELLGLVTTTKALIEDARKKESAVADDLRRARASQRNVALLDESTHEQQVVTRRQGLASVQRLGAQLSNRDNKSFATPYSSTERRPLADVDTVVTTFRRPSDDNHAMADVDDAPPAASRKRSSASRGDSGTQAAHRERNPLFAVADD